MVTGLREGDSITVAIFINEEPVGELTGEVIEETQLVIHVYTDDAFTLMKMHEVIQAARNAIGFHMAKPDLAEMIRARIDELNAMDDSEAGENPPTPRFMDDLPF